MNALTAKLNEMCNKQPFHVGWYVKNLRTGWKADRYGDIVVPSASTRKVAILMTALKGVHEKKFSLEERITPDNNLNTTYCVEDRLEETFKTPSGHVLSQK